MRTPHHLVLFAFAVLTVAVAATPAQGKGAGPGKGAGGPPLQMLVDKTKVDFKEHRLEVKLSRTAGKVFLKVLGESGAVLAEEEQDFSGRPGGTPLVVTWTPSSPETVARIEIRATDAHGFYTTAVLSSWYVPIEHEDVNFRTGSSEIDASEVSKLEAAFTKLNAKLKEILANDVNREHQRLTLFIAGHTDTVGGAAYNLGLSQARARAIAGWFRKRGARVGVAYEGFGETSPAVLTADQIDEPRNRRVDYVVSEDPPAFKTTGFRPSWKKAN